MLGRKERNQGELFVTIPGSLRSLIPDDHILVRVDRVLDLGWLRETCADCYCPDNGRPSIDPEVAVRLMLAGFLLGIVHDRQLMREAEVNIAIRWFAGYGLHERLPDHSSLTRIRQRWGAARFRAIFERIVRSCVEAGLVGGDVLHADATLIRADVSWRSLAEDYVTAVAEANDEGADARPRANERDLPPDAATPASGKGRKDKVKKISRSDPDARMATNSRNQRLEPSYKQLTGVDGKCGIQVDVAVVAGDSHEGGALEAQIDRVEALTEKKVATVTADKAYASAANYEALEKRAIRAVIPPQRTRPGKVPLSRFKYDQRHDLVRCPRGRVLEPAAKAADGRFYRARPEHCGACPLAGDCLPAKARARSVFIKDGHGALLRARRRHAKKLPCDHEAYRSHRFRVEGVHGEAKTRHGLRRAVRRGLENVAIQAYLTAAAINLKRLAKAVLALIFLLSGRMAPLARLLAGQRAESLPKSEIAAPA